MCTAVRFNEKFFGRTLDFERSFGEELILVPRDKIHLLDSQNRYAMLGVGVMDGERPLYFDGVNEWGLCCAALNFRNCAFYEDRQGEGAEVSSSDLISFTLGLCRSIAEVKDMLQNIRIVADRKYAESEGASLHWMFSDGSSSITVESVESGLKIYENPIGVLTNSPEFPYHTTRLADFSALQAENPESRFTHSPLYSRGMGAIGLPGDFSSSSRFARATFVKENFCPRRSSSDGEISEYLSAMSALALPRGCVLSDEGEAIETTYISLMDIENPSYYLTTPACRAVKRATLSDSHCTANSIICAPIYEEDEPIDLI